MVKPLLSLARPALRGAVAALGAQPALVAAASPDTSDEQLTGRQIFLFLLTYVMYVSIYFARKPVSVVKSTLESELGMSRAALGVVDTALLTAYAAGQFMVGMIVQLLGRRVPLVLAYVICGLATTGFAFTNSASIMAVLWGLSGFFASSVHPLMMLFLTDLFPPSLRGTAIGLWQTSQQVGGIAANTAASVVLAKSGWRSVFKTSGATVLFFVPAIVAMSFFAKPPAPSPIKPSKVAAKKAQSVNMRAPSGPKQQEAQVSALSLPGLKSVSAAYTLVKMSRYCLMFWLPYFLSKQ